MLAPPEFLAQQGVELFDIDRGGDVTFHGPGQLVAYPIFDLRSFEPKVGAVEYVRRLEEVLIRTCGDFGSRRPAYQGTDRRLDLRASRQAGSQDRRHRRAHLAFASPPTASP